MPPVTLIKETLTVALLTKDRSSLMVTLNVIRVLFFTQLFAASSMTG
jgi:hypothetical protein